MVVMWAVTTSLRSFPRTSTSTSSKAPITALSSSSSCHTENLHPPSFVHPAPVSFPPTHTPLLPPSVTFPCFHSPTSPVYHNRGNIVSFASSVCLARRRLATEERLQSVMSSPQKKTARSFDIHHDESANLTHHVSLQTSPGSPGNCRKRDLTDTCSCRLK
jgi:hypothetical protein